MKALFPILFLLFLGLVFSPFHGVAQAPADLYLFNLVKSGERYHVFQPRLLSGFNPDGYTNQPWFTPGGDLLVSVRMKEESQNDIYKLSIVDRTLQRITRTTANEFSPRYDPSNQFLSVVRQAQGDSIDQQVFAARLIGGGFRTLTPDRKDIGYYAWLDDNQVALFRIEGETNRLEKYDIGELKARKITSAVGRSLWSPKKGSVLYVHKFSESYWYLKEYNVDSITMEIIVQTPGQSEDFALAPDGTVFMCDGAILLSYHPDEDANWKEVADLSVYGIEKGTRLAINAEGDRIAVVAPKPNP